MDDISLYIDYIIVSSFCTPVSSFSLPLQKKFTKDINYFLKSDQCRNINDDMTIVGIINENVIPNKKEESYYDEPDWEFLSEKIKRILYPHLYESNIKEMRNN